MELLSAYGFAMVTMTSIPRQTLLFNRYKKFATLLKTNMALINQLIMGISSLNHLLREYAKGATSYIKLETLAGSRIAIDLSIMMYNLKIMSLKSSKLPSELICDFVTKAQEHKLVLVFVVDGKNGPEKAGECERRHDERLVLLERIACISKEITETSDELRIIELETDRKHLEELTIRLGAEEKRAIYDQLRSMGCIILIATGEADPLLAFLAKNDYVDYVLSRDTDMFAYGCPKVLREKLDSADSYFNFDYELVNTTMVLIELRVTRAEFLDICILSGCDYYKPMITTGKYDKYWIYAVYSAIKCRKTIERIATNGDLKKTLLPITKADIDTINKVRQMFTILKKPDELIENIDELTRISS